MQTIQSLFGFRPKPSEPLNQTGKSSTNKVPAPSTMETLEQSRIAWKAKVVEQKHQIKQLQECLNANKDFIFQHLVLNIAKSLKQKPELLDRIGFDSKQAHQISVTEIVKKLSELIENEEQTAQPKNVVIDPDPMLADWVMCMPDKDAIEPILKPYQELLTCFGDNLDASVEYMVTIDPSHPQTTRYGWILSSLRSVSWTLLTYGANTLITREGTIIFLLTYLTGLDPKFLKLVDLVKRFLPK